MKLPAPILFMVLFLQACQEPDSHIVRIDHFVPGTDGVQLFVRELINPLTKNSIPLLLIHGGGPGAVASFDLPVTGGSLAEDLANKGRKIYLMNIRGWERSTLPEYDHSDSSLVVGFYVEAAQDIGSVVDWILAKEDAWQVALFGWATGGHWSGYYVTRHPENVAGWIILNSLYGVEAPWELRQFFISPEDSTQYNKSKYGFMRRSGREALTRKWLATIPMDDKYHWTDSLVMRAYQETAVSFDPAENLVVPGGYREESFYMSLGKKYWDAREVQMPALVIRTELDFWSRSEDLQALEKELINAPVKKTISIPGTHYVFLDRPDKGRDRLIGAVLDFLI